MPNFVVLLHFAFRGVRKGSLQFTIYLLATAIKESHDAIEYNSTIGDENGGKENGLWRSYARPTYAWKRKREVPTRKLHHPT